MADDDIIGWLDRSMSEGDIIMSSDEEMVVDGTIGDQKSIRIMVFCLLLFYCLFLYLSQNNYDKVSFTKGL